MRDHLPAPSNAQQLHVHHLSCHTESTILGFLPSPPDDNPDRPVAERRWRAPPGPAPTRPRFPDGSPSVPPSAGPPPPPAASPAEPLAAAAPVSRRPGAVPMAQSRQPPTVGQDQPSGTMSDDRPSETIHNDRPRNNTRSLVGMKSVHSLTTMFT